jgi:tRNA-dihydrouridine synthase B
MFESVFDKKKIILGLSPMDGVTDAAYREISKEVSKVDLIYTEFQNVHGMCLAVDNIWNHFRYSENQRFVIAQIYGHEIEYFFPATVLCLLMGFDGVDINMGCPAKKISDRGAGAGLIKYPEIAKEIIQETKRGRDEFMKIQNEFNFHSKNLSEPEFENEFKRLISYLQKLNPYNPETNSWHSLKIKWKKLTQLAFSKTKEWNVNCIFNSKILKSSEYKTISVKTRIGYDQSTIEQWILQILENDIDFLAIHGRTLKQLYTGSADFFEIEKGILTARANGYTLPILANGDIKSVEDAIKCIEITKANGLLVGRGSYGDPLLLKNIKNHFENKKLENFTNEDIKSIILKHCKIFSKLKGEKQFFQMRKNLGWYISGIPNAVEIRKKLFLTNSTEEVKLILQNI